ncbi:MAG: V-type ATPase subunit [Promethearchaeota archaeon]
MTTRAANEYGYVNARIRGMKSRFLTVGDYERLLQSPSYEDFIRSLVGTYYGPMITSEYPREAPEPAELGLVLARDYANISHKLSKTLSGKVRDFTETYLNMFLAESIKSILRGLHVELEKEEMLQFLVPTSPMQAQEFEELIDTGSVKRAIEAMPYWDVKIALLTRLPAYEELESTAPLEVAVEEWYLRSVLNALTDFSEADRNKVLDVLEARVDLRNALIMIRALALQLEPRIIDMSMVRFTRKSQSLMASFKNSPSWREVLSKLGGTRYSQLAGRLARIYEESNDLSELELAIEDYIAKRVQLQLSAYPFHLGTVLGFFSLKYYEIRNIRSIAVGLERGESPDNIRRMITIW